MAKTTKTTAAMAKPEAAPSTAPSPSAKPGTADSSGKKDKKGKKTRVPYPGLKDAEGKAIRLSEWPADFDPAIHKPLRKVDFVNDSVWYDKKAEEFEAKAKEMREAAELSRKLGNSADRAKAKRLKKMQDSIAKLQAELAQDGIDVEAILAQFSKSE